MVAYGDMECENNRNRVIEKMTARVTQGYWVIGANPPGYKPTAMGGLKEPFYPTATAIKQALEGFAYGTLVSFEEVARFINSQAVITLLLAAPRSLSQSQMGRRERNHVK